MPRARKSGPGHQLRQEKNTLQNAIDYTRIGLEQPVSAVVLSDRHALADARAYIAVLNGRSLLYQPRASTPASNSLALMSDIPWKYLDRAGMQSPDFGRYKDARTSRKLITAATRYIADLNEGEPREAQPSEHTPSKQKIPESLDEDGKVHWITDEEDGKSHWTTDEEQEDAEQSAAEDSNHEKMDAGFRSSSPLPSVGEPPATAEESSTDRALRKMDQWCDMWLGGQLSNDTGWATFDDCLNLPD